MAAARITRSGVDLEATEAGTRITQSFQVTKLPRWLEQLLVRTNPTHIDRSAALREDLHGLQRSQRNKSQPAPRLRVERQGTSVAPAIRHYSGPTTRHWWSGGCRTGRRNDRPDVPPGMQDEEL